MESLNIVILNWNGWHDTQKCIESIISHTYTDKYTILIVDNGSEEIEIKEIQNYCESKFREHIIGTKEEFLSKSIIPKPTFSKAKGKEKIVFIKNGENLGFAKGNNIALRYLKLINSPLAFLLNNDTEIESGAIDMMLDFYESNLNCGAVVPQIRYYQPNNVIWNCGGMINVFGIRKYDYALANISDVPQRGSKKIDYGTGCAILFDINNVGLLSEKFFFGEEDMELAFRLRKLKQPIFCVYDSIIYHKVGASRGQISKNEIGKMVYHYCQRIANLKDNLNLYVWYFSVFLHMVSSVILLKKMKKLSVNRFLNIWYEVLDRSKNESFDLSDFKEISNSKY